jgi:hydroxymethylbilane synthase
LSEALPAKIHNINFVPVRGNISTRVQKLWTQGADGLIVAKAALDRLLEASAPEFAETKAELRHALAQLRWMVLPLRANPTAPAQGALAIEIKRDRADLQALLAPINCADAMAVVNHERAILQAYGGGCHQAIGVSVLRRAYGELKLLRGLDTSGNELNECSLSPVRPRPPKLPLQELWPVTRAEADLFKREPLDVAQPETNRALWVAKADALPDHWQLPHTQLVWASGLQTWRRLAARGIWVNGSAEGLGEQEAPNIEQLAAQTLEWLKLTHADSLAESDMPTLATYRLTPRTEAPDLRGRRCFFWSSGSSFMHALALYPELREQTHCCGPGNTQQVLQQAGVEPHIFLDHQQWLAEMTL